MIWVTWRLHRTQLLILAGLVAVGVAILLYLRADMASYIAAHDLAGCRDQVAQSAACAPLNQAFQERFNDLTKYAQAAFLTMPVILGVFCGGPLFARELEQGTHVLALTQSVSRLRWFAVKVVVAVVPAIAAAGILTAALWSLISVQGWIGVRQQGLFNPLTFDTSGLVPAGYTLFAVATGIALGIITRHTVTAMAGTLGAFPIVRFIGDTIRPHWLNLLPTQRIVHPVVDAGSAVSPDMRVMHTGFLTAGGRILSNDGPLQACIEANHRTGDPTTCYPKLGITQQYADVLTGGQYWAAQLVEAAIFAGLAAVLLGVGIWLLRRRSL
jgi:hypothetical protein